MDVPVAPETRRSWLNNSRRQLLDSLHVHAVLSGQRAPRRVHGREVRQEVHPAPRSHPLRPRVDPHPGRRILGGNIRLQDALGAGHRCRVHPVPLVPRGNCWG